METLICCIGKNENKYINEYVHHYKNLGVTNICLYDNNSIGGERFEDVIQKEIDEGYVLYHNLRGLSKCQPDIYSNCYEEYGSKYDWILFIDCDEYLELVNHSSISDFLSEERFNNFNVIHLNMLNYGDNNQLLYEDKPLKERFPIPLDLDHFNTYEFPDNYHVKSIVRGKITLEEKKLIWFNSHTPVNNLPTCDGYGIQTLSGSPFLPYNYSVAYFKHYLFKSTEEFCNKLIRGYPDQIMTEEKYTEMVNNYFKVNGFSEEKRELMNEKLKEINISIENIQENKQKD